MNIFRYPSTSKLVRILYRVLNDPNFDDNTIMPMLKYCPEMKFNEMANDLEQLGGMEAFTYLMVHLGYLIPIEGNRLYISNRRLLNYLK
jgi:hypothetical protein